MAGLAAVTAVVVPSPVAADGAFPDSMSIFLPPGRPDQILVGTTFGIVRTDDGGAHWHLICEEAITSVGEIVSQYQMGPPPASTLYAVASNEVLTSADSGCSWTTAVGQWSRPFITDAFPDPRDAARLFALALVTIDGDLLSALFESRDGGKSFGAPLYHAKPGVLLTGVESPAAASGAIFVTEYGRTDAGLESLLARSRDDGRSFDEVSLLATFGKAEPRLAAIDPVDAQTIYYRAVDGGFDKLAISRDGGQTAAIALAVEDEMSGFLRRADGTLLVAARTGPGWRSSDGGRSFAPWPEGLRLRGMRERGGVLYAVGDDSPGGFGVGSSADGGKSWTALLHFADICGVLACSPRVSEACRIPWQRLIDQVGVQAACAVASPGADAGADAAVTTTTTPPPPAGGGGCALAPGRAVVVAVGPLVLIAALALAAIRRRR